ncbi:glycerophosphodiester phosphodiesterase family protein [Peptococcus simiae]|uniref:Glycerophosphodiester phosphodiesterase family protein n=1 Tax=Peptococcus simiae TaxID=1643805 RepID=A0ABW9GYE7_9FIRM
MRRYRDAKLRDIFMSTHYAHRGIHDSPDCPENSLAAFKKAVDLGYGIELDVQESHDGKLVIHHDLDLERMTGLPGLVGSTSYAHMRDRRLKETDQRIPTLAEVLALVDGQVPLLIEVKSFLRPKRFAEELRSILRGYQGPYMIESFNPWFLRRYYALDNRVWLGQLSQHFPDVLGRLFLSTLLCSAVSKPDFISYSIKAPNRFALWVCKTILRKPLFGWTVRDDQAYQAHKGFFDLFIFEHIRPGKPDNADMQRLMAQLED